MSKYSWSDDSDKGPRLPVAKGRRLIMVHAGNENGFVKDGLVIFVSGTKSGDYHDDMNWTNFSTWVRNHLLPNLPPNSVLVVDNASYHNTKDCVEPTMATKKAEMISWLTHRNIHFDSSLTKPEIYNIVKQYKSATRVYKLNVLMNEHGHSVLRLPPYHPELNPIEKVWAQVKQWVAAHNVGRHTISELKELTKEAFTKVTNERWAAICQHVCKVEEDYIKNEPLLDDTLEEFIISVNTGSSDEEESDEDLEVENIPNTNLGVSPLL